MAELLVRASPHWMDTLKVDDLQKRTEQELVDYNSRTQRGDIIVVKPDKWEWGTLEGLPDFIIIKFPDVRVEDVGHLIDKLSAASATSITTAKGVVAVSAGTLLKRRKYQVPKALVDQAVAERGVLTIKDAQPVLAQLTAKVS